MSDLEDPDVREAARNVATVVRIMHTSSEPGADLATMLSGLSFTEHSHAFVAACNLLAGVLRDQGVDIGVWVDEFIRRIDGGDAA